MGMECAGRAKIPPYGAGIALRSASGGTYRRANLCIIGRQKELSPYNFWSAEVKPRGLFSIADSAPILGSFVSLRSSNQTEFYLSSTRFVPW